MMRYLRPALMLLLGMSLLTGVFYPLLMTGIGHVLFPRRADGSIIVRNGRAVGSLLIGQQFSSPKYFWSRLSATQPFPYNASSSAASNYGPLNPAFLKSAKNRIDALHAADPTNRELIPVDLVTSSASGLDPQISPAAAMYQIHRVARERKLSEEKVRALVGQYTEPRGLGICGEAGVNVVELNLALDQLQMEQQ
jgi:K+-transporting ATPase ATPase C chain